MCGNIEFRHDPIRLIAVAQLARQAGFAPDADNDLSKFPQPSGSFDLRTIAQLSPTNDCGCAMDVEFPVEDRNGIWIRVFKREESQPRSEIGHCCH